MRTREYLLRMTDDKRNIKSKHKKKRYEIKRYIAVLEIEEGNNNDWNIHYHCIFDSGYIEASDLRLCFNKASKYKSWHVNIQFISNDNIRSKKKAAYYICKYLSKSNYRGNLPKMLEYYEATAGLRYIKNYKSTLLKESKKRYGNFKNYLYKIGYSKLDIQIIINELLNKMLKIDSLEYDISRSIEENAFLYGRDSDIIKKLGGRNG